MKNALSRAMRALTRGGLVTLATLTLATTTHAAAIVSDGSDGAFSGGGTLQLDADGIFNFTNITIPNGATLRLTPNAANTPAVLAATGDVVIDGTIDVSAGHFSRLAYGPGGGSGGLAGHGAEAGTMGTGPSPGAGGEFPRGVNPGNAGGGGGMATPGLVATQYTNSAPGAGGDMIGFSGPVGGSGGGGGSGAIRFADLSGGVGGAGGGGLLITTPGTITVNGTVLANGGHAGWAFANVFGYGGPGGGGSGGNIMLEATEISLGATATVSALGGAGGGLSTQPVPNNPYFYSNHADGGLGYLSLVADTVTIDPAATVNAAVVPVPPAIWLFGSVLLGGALRRRHRESTSGKA